MPVSQRVIFTLVPNGLLRTRALINLHIAPRLDLTDDIAPPELSQFPSWASWAETINAARVRILVNGQPVDARRLQEADPAIWSALLPPDTRVKPRKFEDLRGTDVLTNPIGLLAGKIEDDYVALAGESGDTLPDTPRLEKGLRYRPSDRLGRRELLALLRDSEGTRPISNRGILTALMAEYHAPLMAKTVQKAEPDAVGDGTVPAEFLAHDRVAMPTAAELAARIDFHQIVSALGQHPFLMRACGLVVPLSVAADEIPASADLQVEIDWDSGNIPTDPDIRPITRSRRTADDFRARPRAGSTMTGGWLKLDPASFAVVAMDADGAGLSLKNFAINLPSIREERFDDEHFFNDVEAARVGSPRLRSVGLQLAQIRRDRAIRVLFEGSGALQDAVEGGTTPILYAEDIIRGWRADIRDVKTSRWQSLLRFNGRYELLNDGQGLDSEDDESTLRLGASKAPDGQQDNVLKASEAMFAWSGWSLAAPPVGRAILPDETDLENPAVPDEQKFAEDPEEVPDGLPLRVRAKVVPGSLPLLRFGRTYRVRMRYADIAGGGIAWTPRDGPAGTETEDYYFGRYEPVESPTLTLLKGDPDPKDGESMARAALRTMDDPARNDIQARRNVVPPRVGAKFAELHGVMDAVGKPDPAAYPLMLARDQDFEQRIVTTDAYLPEGAPGVPEKVETVFADGDEATITPYLYDPMAAGVALRISGVPGIDPDKVHMVPFYGDVWKASDPIKWADARGFSLVAREGGTTGWDPATRSFVVALDKGERARIRTSALVPTAYVPLFKLLERLKARAEAEGGETQERYQRALALVRRGQHWMFTPWRTVELVHALQRPLVKPEFLMLWASRQAGDLTARIGYSTPIHCKSTVRLDMDGEWIEIDDHGDDGPVVKRMKADAFRRPLARLDFPGGRLQRIFNDHAFADTRARHVDYRMTVTTRFREFMPLDIRQDAAAITHVSAQARAMVPSSSAPPPPVIRYVVPTFGWSSTGGDNASTRRKWRHGGGIRVYLERPWYGSGSNELLAVLLPRGSGDPVALKQQDFVTQWGRDPIWAGQTVATIAPKKTDFPRRVESGPIPFEFDWLGALPGSEAEAAQAADRAALEREGADTTSMLLTRLRPQGAPDGLEVDAVPHAVGYDRARKLWYCDIVIAPGRAYFPFIRLALARYQPHAVSGLELSSVAMASFQQLSPDRVATVSAAPDFGGNARRVQVHGIMPSDGNSRPRAGLIRLQLQRMPANGDPDLDWRDTDWGQQPPRPFPFGAIARTSSGFAIPRAQLSRAQIEMVREGEGLIAAGRFVDVLARPDIVDLLLPPLIDESVIFLPPANGDRLRLLITESESYHYARDDYSRAPDGRERIVYAATFEVS